MSQQSSGQGQKVSYRDNIFLGHDRLWLRQRVSCRDKVFCVAIGCGQDQGVLFYDKSICVMTKLG